MVLFEVCEFFEGIDILVFLYICYRVLMYFVMIVVFGGEVRFLK